MALQLHVDLENEILSRLPPHSLVRFRSVCKRWNSLLKDKRFVNNHLSRSRPQLFFYANRKAYLIDVMDIGPRINLRDLPSFDIPLEDSSQDKIVNMGTCDEFLFCDYLPKRVMGFWNPWLRQVKLFEYDYVRFYILGLGYDNSRHEKAYKVLGFVYDYISTRAAIFDCESQVFKFIDSPDSDRLRTEERPIVSLNGNLYWVSLNPETQKWFIQTFDFSMEIFKPFCLLPCQKSHCEELLVLAAYKADQFSLLKLPYRAEEIEIWVTKNKICREEKDVVWIKLMTLPASNFPRLFQMKDHISYIIYNKTLFMCCDDHETGFACIYIVREDLCKRIQIDSVIRDCHHSFYTPNFISVPYFGD